ncbi:MAG TPA: TniQ family protein [Planctomicrobium sp.]|nr:TniQ family protein [Planctomicrobium sp.]
MKRIIPRLPAREPMLPGESLESLVRRQALAMGYEQVGRISALVRERGELPPSFNHLFSGPVLESLGKLFGIPVASLLQATVHRFTEQLVLVRQDESLPVTCGSKTILRFFRRGTSPICPECLREEPVYERLLWSFQPLPVCLEHERFLVDRCPNCGRGFSSQRLDVRHCRCGHPLMNASQVPLSGSLIESFRSIQNVLLDGKSSIPGMSTAAQFWWLERLFSAVTRTPSWIAGLRQHEEFSMEIQDQSLAWLAAAEMLVDWPRRFEEFLEVFQTVIKHRTTSTGVSRSFGLLLREAKWLEDRGYPASAEVLRAYLLQRYTLGHLTAKVCLFQGTAKTQMKDRPWLTRTQTAKQLGVRHGAIADLLRRGLLDGEVRTAGARGRSVGVVSRDTVLALQRQLASSVTIPVAAKWLGIGRHAVLEMVHRNLLEKSVRTAKGWLIPKETIENWEAFIKHLPVQPGTSVDWLTLREATRRFGKSGFTLTVVLDLVRSRRVRACRSHRTSVVGAILVNHNDLQLNQEQVQTQQNAEAGYSVHQLSKVLIPGRPLKAIVLQKWIGAGLLAARRRGRILIVMPAEVERFRKTYCLAGEACALLGISRKTLSRWEEADRIEPVYGRRSHEGAGASVFLRDDVERLRNKEAAPDAETFTRAA